MKKRSRELDGIFRRLYEDSVLGRITAEQFQTLSGSYTQEMEMLNKAIPEKETAIQRLQEQVSSTDHFISLAKRYTDIRELTPELLRLFIQKDRCPRKGREVEQARPADSGDPLQ